MARDTSRDTYRMCRRFTLQNTGRKRWRRWESNPRPEMFQNCIYVRSL